MAPGRLRTGTLQRRPACSTSTGATGAATSAYGSGSPTRSARPRRRATALTTAGTRAAIRTSRWRSRPIRPSRCYKHGGQPGTIWDMFGIKASESATTSSLARQPNHHESHRVPDRQEEPERPDRRHAAALLPHPVTPRPAIWAPATSARMSTRATTTSACWPTSPAGSRGTQQAARGVVPGPELRRRPGHGWLGGSPWLRAGAVRCRV